EDELKNSGASRATVASEPAAGTLHLNGAGSAAGDPKTEFKRMLRLSGLDRDAMTDDQRDAFINVAENSGLDPGEAEDMVDAYLEEIDEHQTEKMSTVTQKSFSVVPDTANKPIAKAIEEAPLIIIAEPRPSPDEER